MAKVIDRLRIQGISASREHHLPPPQDVLPKPPSTAPNPDTGKSWIANGDTFYMSSQRQKGGKDFLSSSASPASRQMKVMMRMRTANQGLSASDGGFGPSSLQFVLRGRPVKYQPDHGPSIVPSTLFSGSLSRSNRDSEIKVHVNKARSEPVSSGNIQRVNKYTKIKDDSNLPSFSSPNFMLGPAASPSYGGTFLTKRGPKQWSAFELTGQRVDGLDNGYPRTGYTEVYPHIETPVRSQRRWTRSAYKDSPTPSLSNDSSTLNQCLSVNQSLRLPVGTQSEAIKLKHYTQFIKKDGKMNFNNPYRKHRKMERRTIRSNTHYQFDSVSSYVHFNRIYQPPTPGTSVAVHVPQLSGFPAHCTDTVMLRMMLEMNKSLRKSPDRFTDGAIHRDLDDFLMVRSPSAYSKTASAHSKKTNRNKSSKSGHSHLNLGIDEGPCEWAEVDVPGPTPRDDFDEKLLEEYQNEEDTQIPDTGEKLKDDPRQEQEEGPEREKDDGNILKGNSKSEPYLDPDESTRGYINGENIDEQE